LRTKSLAAAALIAGAAMFLVGALMPLGADHSDAGPIAASTADTDAVAPVTSTSLDATIKATRERISASPESPKLYAQLGLAYLQQARNEADPSVLPSAERALRGSLELQQKNNLEAFIGMASLANARHDFSQSVEWSRRAIDTNPYNAAAYGLLGDALFELGHVRAADAAYQKMIDRRPDVASYVRASYALQYDGRFGAAIHAMRLALQAAGPSGEVAAWVRHQMGDIYAQLGDTSEVVRQNRIGIAIAPDYAPPRVGLAETHITRGHPRRALRIMRFAVDRLPSLEYMITLGDLYQSTGRRSQAEVQYARVADLLGAYRSAGVLPDADFIVFYADHHLRPAAALREAFAIYRNRPTTKSADALAWMLHSAGRNHAAWRYAREAFEASDRSSSTLFRAGTIARSLGWDDEAKRLMRKAIRLDPAFSVLHAPIARRVVAGP
jgi:tetratricopeptide (TPR) repeat protein